MKIPKESRDRAVASIKRYFSEELEEEVGDLKAGLFLDYCMKEFCPLAYNQGVADAQAYIRDRVADIDAACFEPEFTYWKPKKGSRGR